MKLFLYLLSFLLVAFGQSSFIPLFGIGAASIGYALFWFAIIDQQKTKRFWACVLWYGLIQGIQLSWFCSIKYMGPAILVVYLLVSFLIAVQFGFLSLFLDKARASLRACLALAGCWSLLEYLRLFFFSGFPWNPSGLALGSSQLAVQFAAVLGVYGLSFWVMFTNAFALYSLKSWKRGAVWVLIAATPYSYGVIQQEWVRKNVFVEKTFEVALVQTGLLPEEKDRFPGLIQSYVPPLNQWERIWDVLSETENLDLIVLPETAVGMPAKYCQYPIDLVKVLWEIYFGESSSKNFPSLEAPFARYSESKGWCVSNLFLTQALANHFGARTISGFVDEQYNAAFDFIPQGPAIKRYEKRILVPMGEYVPFSENAWVSNFLSENFGVYDSFTKGKEVSLFTSLFPIGVSICSEETYGHLLRRAKLSGARLFVNLTNDVWFPSTHLPFQHFQHGQIRSCENGVCSLRACNTGLTGAIDCCGKVLGTIPPSEEKTDVLFLSVPIQSFKTLYSWWGDSMILILSSMFLFLSFGPISVKRFR